MKRTSYPDGVDPDDVESVMRALGAGAFDTVAQGGSPLEKAGRVSDLSLLLAGIDQALPRPAMLFVEGTSIAPDVKKLLDGRSVQPGRDDLWGTVWPRSDGFHIRVTDENMRDLLKLADHHATPEICDHLTVYCGERILLVAHDVGSDDVWLDGGLPPQAMARFRRVANAI